MTVKICRKGLTSEGKELLDFVLNEKDRWGFNLEPSVLAKGEIDTYVWYS